MDGNGQIYDKKMENVDQAFDVSVSRKLGDYHRKYVHGGNNISEGVRGYKGINKGYEDAPEIIESLHRTNGYIDETVKFITHSMGSLYGDGYIKGFLMYVNEHPELKNQILITLVADLDPFQAGLIVNKGKIKKQQFVHKGFSISGGLANQREQNIEDNNYNESSQETAHSIMTFFDDIKNLEEGTYKWNDRTKQWELQTGNNKTKRK